MLRVAFVLRSTEVQPEFFDLFTLSFISLMRLLKLAGAFEDGPWPLAPGPWALVPHLFPPLGPWAPLVFTFFCWWGVNKSEKLRMNLSGS